MNSESIIVFIDTSIFEGENFFKGRNLLKLCELSKSKIVEIKITDIIYEEIKQRIKSNLNKSQIAIKKSAQLINGEAKILKNLKEFDDISAILRVDFIEIQNQFLEKLENFISEYNIEIIDSNISDVNEVFHDYFKVKPPFKEGAKKSEFPDAFSNNTIKKWTELSHRKIIFLSTDTDFAQLSFKNIDYSHNISTLLDHISRNTNELHASFIENQMEDRDYNYIITNKIEENYDFQLMQAVEENIFYYLDLFDPEIDNLQNFYAVILSNEINSIEQNDYVIFEIVASISFSAEVSYYDISAAFYDKEDDEWYGKEQKTVTKNFSATVIFLAKFDYNLNDEYFDFNEITNFEVQQIEEE